jgi:hypothetical protein
MITRQIWEQRAQLLKKAKSNELTFTEFCLITMHKETKNYLNKTGGLSKEGTKILQSIEAYLETTK